MARVNHKKVKQLLNEKRSKITDRQFFTSRILAGHFEDMAAAQTRRYHYNRRVRVSLYWKTTDPNVAVTDNMCVAINCGNQMVTKVRGRENRYQIVCGLFAHELGHVLYTDFLTNQTYHNNLEMERWYPSGPMLNTSADIRREKAFWNYVKADPKNKEMVHIIAHNIWNILEDAYIENRMLNNFPGTLGYGLEDLRELHFSQVSTVTELIEAEERDENPTHIFESILQIMLSYAKWGEIKYGEEPLSDERIQTVFQMIPQMDDAICTRSAKERWDVVNWIIVRCWDYIEDFCEACKQRQEDAEAAGGTATVAETLSQILQSIAGSSDIGEGSSSPVPESSGDEEKSATAEKRAQTKADAESARSESEGNSEKPDESGEERSSSSGSENSSGDSDESEEMASVQSGSGEGEKQEVSEKEKGRIPHTQTSSVSTPVGGTTERNDTYEREKYDHAAEDIDRLLEKMAEKAACEQLENERLRELNDAAQSISFGNVHSGVNIRVNRITDVDEQLVDQYNEIAPKLLTISRQLQKSIIRQLKDSRRGGKQTGLMMGRRLDSHALHRNDGKVFYKNALPNEIPELAVALLLDESGSMSSCDRCTYARASAIILYDFCQSLEIPVMVYGHSTGYSHNGHSVELFSYAEFESYDQDDKYRMIDIGARGSNRDGAALRFVAEQLSKRPEQVKMLILVSDGQPADLGYGGTAAEEDLRGIKLEYQRKGILFVAAAIGEDKQNIERIYGDSFLDISVLNQLPVKLTSVVKRFVRV